ncbi:hypothetical protein P344_03940 [Spiroplasma mirum ATCC 29335]|uniref:Aminoglycoside phosphotransferase domain-containing protein n=1 Tax=Spiroplasma mirum ATCC 29335 TaxID=838561 RepID=W0GLG9_9MOLU|nr:MULTISPECIES: phosphotransferase [Spiroplasma]AHF61085.1 putative choline kinase [Spiroplasma mirum ATCC 29335]AHI58123.1 hypothetical protein P344_03940 [Spiroplasma mirum ATCC 29335]AKM53182.1 putative choline kinase [Spiroplasma atrichopogonis]
MKFEQGEKLNKGLTNINYRWGEFFVRYEQPFTRLFLDHENEMNVLKALQHQNINLKVVETGYDNDHFYVITKYYPNCLTLGQTGLGRSNLTRVSYLIKKLHQVDVRNYNIKTFNPRLFLQTMKQHIKKIIYNLDQEENLINPALYQPINNAVLCHNDLTSDNFIFIANRLYLIDYEYAMLNDPLFDIASFASETLTQPADIKYWFDQFNLTTAEHQRVVDWMYYQNILWIYWANYMYEHTNNAMFLKIMEAKYQKLKIPTL